MNRIRIYTDEEIESLMQSGLIVGIKNKSQIIYKNEFKLWSIYEKLSHPEKTARQIFESAGFDIKIFDERTPQKRLSSWVNKYKMYGEDYFLNNNKYSYTSKKNNSKLDEINISKNKDNYFLLKINKDELSVIPISIE